MKSREKYTLQNPLMFTVIMKEPKRCIGLIERIFPGRKVKELKFVYGADEDEVQSDFLKKIAAVEPETERTYIVSVEAKAIRMDVLFENSDAWYDIEMQVYNTGNIPRRSRYYHAVKTVDSLKAGHNYNELKEGYVIFINGFDLFGRGEPVYSFKMFDEKLQLSLNDGQHTIFLNSTCRNNVPPELEGFYRYLQTGEVTTDDDWLVEIAHAVDDANQREEVRDKVTLYDELKMLENMVEDKNQEIAAKDYEIAAKDHEIAAKDHEIAAKDHEIANQAEEIANQAEEIANQAEELASKELFNRLIIILAQQGRTDEILRAAEDETYRNKLIAEFNI